MPCAVSGIDDLAALLAAVVEVRAHEGEAGELALRPGGRLQRDGVEPDHLGQHPLEPPHQLERALGAVVVLMGVQVPEPAAAPTARSLTRGLYFIVHEPSG